MAPNSRIHALLGARILNFTKLSSDKQEKKPPERKSQSSKPDHFCPGGFFSVPLTKIKLIIYFPSPIINSSPYGKVLIQSQNVCHSASL